MRTCHIFLLLLVAQAGLAGCHRCHVLWNNVARTVHREPKCFDNCDRTERFREIACSYWNKQMRSGSTSMHMKSGFIEGFSDYLHRGGSGLAPIAPPRRYWEPSTSTNRQNAISQWKSGFEQGSQIARESGLRELIVIPFDDGVLAASHHGHYGDTSNMENTPLVADASFYQVHGSEVQSEPVHGEQVLREPVQNNHVQDKQVQSSPVQNSPVQHNLAQDKPAHNSAVQHLPAADSSIENESEFVDEENIFYDLPSSPKAKEASVVPGFYEKFDKTDEMPTSASVFEIDEKDIAPKSASILGIDTVGSIPFPRESLAGNDPLFP